MRHDRRIIQNEIFTLQLFHIGHQLAFGHPSMFLHERMMTFSLSAFIRRSGDLKGSVCARIHKLARVCGWVSVRMRVCGGCLCECACARSGVSARTCACVRACSCDCARVCAYACVLARMHALAYVRMSVCLCV